MLKSSTRNFMSLRSCLAASIGRFCAFVLTHIFHRDASQLPGRIALSLAGPEILSDLRARLTKGAIMVCGTNGKTTTNNVLAAALKESGASVVCNYAGANMLSGIVSALLPLSRHGAATDWAVLEVDELSSAYTLPQIKPNYFVLLNLFRDQLDRAGEIDKIQDVIATSLNKTPDTTLVACGDDPLCMGVVEHLKRLQAELGKAPTATTNDEPGAPKAAIATANDAPASANESISPNIVTFGIGEETGDPTDRVPEARFCQVCGTELAYIYRHYAQLGNYQCPNGDFSRPALNFSASDVTVDKAGVDFAVNNKAVPQQSLHVPFGGLYMVYNILAAYAVAALIGIPTKDFQHAVSNFHPDNGRLQNFNLAGQEVILNLAKNPTGFNQNISLMLADPRPKHAFFVVNDNFNDGKDISWIWDVDFERLNAEKDLAIFVGGTRANDLAVRMKYAGFGAVPLYFTAEEALAAMGETASEKTGAPGGQSPASMAGATPENAAPAKQPLYILTNYSALWPIKAELEKIQKRERT